MKKRASITLGTNIIYMHMPSFLPVFNLEKLYYYSPKKKISDLVFCISFLFLSFPPFPNFILCHSPLINLIPFVTTFIGGRLFNYHFIFIFFKVLRVNPQQIVRILEKRNSSSFYLLSNLNFFLKIDNFQRKLK